MFVCLSTLQGYLWLPYDLAEVIKLIGEILGPKTFFFQKKYFVIPSPLVSFLHYYCHSFCIIVIPYVLVSFLPYYCHSFHIIVIPSKLHIVISKFLNSSCALPWPYLRVIVIFPLRRLSRVILVVLDSSIKGYSLNLGNILRPAVLGFVCTL